MAKKRKVEKTTGNFLILKVVYVLFSRNQTVASNDPARSREREKEREVAVLRTEKREKKGIKAPRALENRPARAIN